MENIVLNSATLGFVISLLAYEIGLAIKKNGSWQFKSSSDFHSSGYWSPDPVWRRLRQL